MNVKGLIENIRMLEHDYRFYLKRTSEMLEKEDLKECSKSIESAKRIKERIEHLYGIEVKDESEGV